MTRYGIVLILQANHSSRRFVMPTMVDEYCMGGGHQSCIRFASVARIEWYAEYETIRFNSVVINRPFIPIGVHRFRRSLTEMPVQ